MKYRVKTKSTHQEIEKKEKTTLEEKFYWTRALVSLISAIFGILVFNLVGWGMFLYLAFFMFGWPFIQSFLIFRLPYEKEKWDWKQILKTGIGVHFFIFMVISSLLFTYTTYSDWGDRLSNPADTHEIIINDEFGYIADGENGFLIVNLENHSPSKLGEYKSTELNIKGVNIQNNYAYLNDISEGMIILDITDKENPTKISNISFSSGIQEIYVEQNIAYVSLKGKGLVLVDVLNAENPTVVSTLDIGNYTTIEILNKIGYLGNNDSFQIVNFTNSQVPEIIGQITLENTIYDIAINDTNVFIAAGTHGLLTVNITDAISPTLISSYNISADYQIYTNSTNLVFENNIAYVSTGTSGIAFIDVSNPNNPKIIGEEPYNTIGTAEYLEINDNQLYVADGNRGLTIINLLDPVDAPSEVTAGGNKTISFGLYWVPISIIVSLIIIKRKKISIN